MSPSRRQATRPRGRHAGSSHARRKVTATLSAVTLGLGVAVAAVPASQAADITAALSISKTASASDVAPGQAFVYTLQLECTAAQVACCVNLSIAHTMPQYIQVTGAATVTGHAGTEVVTWQQTIVSIVFTDDLGGGSTGLVAAQIVIVTIPARLDPDVPYAASGTDLDNTATISAANADPQRSTATVTPQIELDLDATVTKNIDPSGALPEPGTPLSVDLTGSNQSNTAVDNLVISDPVDHLDLAQRANVAELTDPIIITNDADARSCSVRKGPSHGLLATPTASHPPT